MFDFIFSTGPKTAHENAVVSIAAIQANFDAHQEKIVSSDLSLLKAIHNNPRNVLQDRVSAKLLRAKVLLRRYDSGGHAQEDLNKAVKLLSEIPALANMENDEAQNSDPKIATSVEEANREFLARRATTPYQPSPWR